MSFSASHARQSLPTAQAWHQAWSRSSWYFLRVCCVWALFCWQPVPAQPGPAKGFPDEVFWGLTSQRCCQQGPQTAGLILTRGWEESPEIFNPHETPQSGPAMLLQTTSERRHLTPCGTDSTANSPGKVWPRPEAGPPASHSLHLILTKR